MTLPGARRRGRLGLGCRLVKIGVSFKSAMVTLLLGACGGRSTTDLTNGNGGTGAHGGSVSTGGTGGTTSVGGGHVEGGTGGVSSGATSGSGGTGDTCYYAGTYYVVGDSYPADDGCNYCTCTPSGSVCGSTPCTGGASSSTGGTAGGVGASCDDVLSKWSAAYTRAQKCTPGMDSCSSLVANPRCGCQSYVTNSIELDQLVGIWDDERCSDFPVSCPLCVPVGKYHYCGDSGTCVSSDTAPTGGASGMGGLGGAAGLGGMAGFTTGGLAGAGGVATGGLAGAGGVATGGLGGNAGANSGGLAGGAGSATVSGGFAGSLAAGVGGS